MRSLKTSSNKEIAIYSAITSVKEQMIIRINKMRIKAGREKPRDSKEATTSLNWLKTPTIITQPLRFKSLKPLAVSLEGKMETTPQ